jgi:hypothetical protein
VSAALFCIAFVLAFLSLLLETTDAGRVLGIAAYWAAALGVTVAVVREKLRSRDKVKVRLRRDLGPWRVKL